MSGDNELHERSRSSSNRITSGTIKVQTCPECGSTRLMRDYECAEIVCMDCGFVVQQKSLTADPNGEHSTTNNAQNEPESEPP